MTPAERSRLRGLEQGSPDWHEARRGCITASLADRLLTVSDRSLPSLVAALRNDEGIVRDLSGIEAVRRGVLDEPRARALYELRTGVEVEPVGLLVHGRYDLVRCSPDGMVVGGGGIEIKRPSNLGLHYEALAGRVPVFRRPQVQFSLWVSDEPWWDYVSFSEGVPLSMQLAVVRVVPCARTFEKFERQVHLLLPYLDGGLK